MPLLKELRRWQCGDMTAIWYEKEQKVMFGLVPTSRLNDIPVHREYIPADVPAQRGLLKAFNRTLTNVAVSAESCLQLKYSGTAQGGAFQPGESMRESECCQLMRFQGFETTANGMALIFRDDKAALEARQDYAYQEGDSWITVNTTVKNLGEKPLRMEFLASFALGMLSIFQPGDGKDCCSLMQWHSSWAGEGRLEERPIEDAGFEPSWNSWGNRSLRFGNRTSMPVKGFYPQVGIADNRANVVWGASLEAFGPWQMEVFRMSDFMSISGGWTDREFNQWTKVLNPGESLAGIPAALTCASVPKEFTAAETLCNRLAPFAGTAPENITSTEANIPAIFNDWCKNWGKPYRANLEAVAERLQHSVVAYLNMDAGWYRGPVFGSDAPGTDHINDIGDWNLNDSEETYPGGFMDWIGKIQSCGMKAGIWFEFENALERSLVREAHPDWFLTLDGQPIHSGQRLFLDFRKPEVVKYLKEKVIDFLKKYKIGYMKVDYNAPTGALCDGPNESKSENLRQALSENWKFFALIRKELPELTLEICSSGGYRTSAGWMRLGAMASSSDAHEGVEIPLLAGNTAMLIAARNNQIWATLHDWDDEHRLYYSLCAGCIGRLCLSGDIDQLAEWKMDVVRRALDFYEAEKSVILAGNNSIQRRLLSRSYIEPEGEQLFTRVAAAGDKMVAILHTFEHSDACIQWQLPGNQWSVPGKWTLDTRSLIPSGVSVTVTPQEETTLLRFENMPDFSACALLLTAL